MTNINEIVNALAFISSNGNDNSNLAKLIEIENISLPLAFAVDFGYATLTPKGEENLELTYNHLKAVADERGLDDVLDLAFTDTPVPTRKIFIKI